MKNFGLVALLGFLGLYVFFPRFFGRVSRDVRRTSRRAYSGAKKYQSRKRSERFTRYRHDEYFGNNYNKKKQKYVRRHIGRGRGSIKFED